MSAENQERFQRDYGKTVPRMTHDRAIALLEEAASALLRAQDVIGRYGPHDPLYEAITDLRRDIHAFLCGAAEGADHV